MRKRHFFLASIILLSVFIDFSLAHSKVLLRDIQVLTLKQGRKTTARRTSPIQQISCIGGDACKSQADKDIKTIQCINKGWDGTQVQWECKADLDDTVRFGETTVSCEGWNRPGDAYVLAGSCGVEYTLYHTAKGRQLKNKQRRYGSNNHFDNYYDAFSTRMNSRESWWNSDKSWWNWVWSFFTPSTFVAYQAINRISNLFSVFAVIAIVYLLWRTCFSPSRRSRTPNQNNRRFWGNNFGGFWNPYSGPGGGGGGGYSGNNGSPPPYCDPTSTSQPPPSNRFWHGFTLGGILGSLAGRASSNNYYYTPRWGYGGYSTAYTRPATRTTWRSENHNGSSSSSESRSSTTTTRTASGFGGTNVR